MNYDIIGDIHGEHGKLVGLLGKLGYRPSGGAWKHPDRTVLFVGDFIDRGPDQLETVDTVRRMVDAGNARAVMGNHEFNAIGWATKHPENGAFLRPHTDKNRKQHKKFLDAVVEDSGKHREIIAWFRQLPLWLDLLGLRVVHACWHPTMMDYLAGEVGPDTLLSDQLLLASTEEPPKREHFTPGVSAFKAVEAILKGPEVPLPNGYSFYDKDGHERHSVRIKWWDAEAITYADAAIVPPTCQLPHEAIPEHVRLGYKDTKPVFFGHYWFPPGERPAPLSPKASCLDYSAVKSGPLTAYRWDGEPDLDIGHFVQFP